MKTCISFMKVITLIKELNIALEHDAPLTSNVMLPRLMIICLVLLLYGQAIYYVLILESGGNWSGSVNVIALF